MQTIIYAGPTFGNHRPETGFACEWRPPVSFGDVFRAVLEGATVIGIIDGYFEDVPSVWHKEILWALHRGCYVYGSSSMGALRAAELARFGMRGVGLVYEAFHTGQLSDDDEVAVRHAPAELNFLALSEAMVNIRFTMHAAVSEGVVSPDFAQLVVLSCKRKFYPERDFSFGCEKFYNGPYREEALSLNAWLPTGRVDQKRLDALMMLSTIEQNVSYHQRRNEASFFFECSTAWVSAMLKTKLVNIADLEHLIE